MERLPFYLNLRNRLISQELLLIGGEIIITQAELEQEEFWSGDLLWTKIQGYELFIIHEEKALEILIEEANQLHPEYLSIRFHLENIDGEQLVSKIREAINKGVAEYSRQRPNQQLNLF